MSEADLDKLVRATVVAVLAQLRAQPEAGPRGPLVRVLISDVDNGLDLALASLAALPAPRPRLEYVLTSGETSQVTPAHVTAVGAATNVVIASAAGCPRKFARGADAVVAATLDRATAMRVALTMPEGFAAKFLFEALTRGKPTILASDALELARPDATPQLRAALAEPVSRLEVFGAAVVPARDLGAALATVLAPPAGYNAAQNRPLICVEDVEGAAGELTLPPHAIITPLALERARELGVVLRRIPH